MTGFAQRRLSCAHTNLRKVFAFFDQNTNVKSENWQFVPFDSNGQASFLRSFAKYSQIGPQLETVKTGPNR